MNVEEATPIRIFRPLSASGITLALRDYSKVGRGVPIELQRLLDQLEHRSSNPKIATPEPRLFKTPIDG